ncbi:MAG: D-glycero-beta-D-manno-heptose 1-phosphate adenylyltransferase [Anaerolineae bacterium]
MGEIVSLEDAVTIREKLRAEGKTVVLTNGHFDILHMGHVDCLQRAKALGDVLIVGLNSDASTRLLKGQKRPIVPQEERARLLAALQCVDYVIIFEERTAERLLAALKPEAYVKGGDWASEDLPEAEAIAKYGVRVEILPQVPSRSTTDIIETILTRYKGDE